MTGNLYLLGFMGSGKSTVGQRLADALNRKFVDMDDLLVKRFGMPIHEVFARLGEDAFREAESGLLKSLSLRKRLVVATGGGAIGRDQNISQMRSSGKMVYLEASLETCMKRLSVEERAERPLWTNGDGLHRLFEQRKALYAQGDHRVSVEGIGAQEVVEEIMNSFFPDQRVCLVLDGADCPVVCTWHAPEVLAEWVAGRRVFLLTDQTLARILLHRYCKVLKDPIVALIPPGEKTKTLHSAKKIYEKLLEHRMERDDLLVAVGGGVVTDLGAFVAATYKRGMKLILVATSLLGCVDAAIGGKAAVNLGKAKNVVGSFEKPAGVLLDVLAIRTIPRPRVAEGVVEAYKTGLVASPQLTDFVQRELGTLMQKDLPALAELVVLSSKIKADIVSQDFREKGLRRILNFGHTTGHAIEAWNRYRVSHGQAVAAGMIVATRLSKERKLIPVELADLIQSTIRRIVRLEFNLPPVEHAWEIMQHDKKIRGGRLVFVLLSGVGKPVFVHDVSLKELSRAFKGLQED